MIPKYKQLHECFDISFLTKVITNIVVESKIPKYIPRWFSQLKSVKPTFEACFNKKQLGSALGKVYLQFYT